MKNVMETFEILIFKTDIRVQSDLNRVSPLLLKETRIKKWNIDTQDVDNVLRIESQQLTAQEIILLIKQSGHCCEELLD